MTRSDDCPSTWALERVLLGEVDEGSELERHVASCDECRAELAQRRAVGNRFMASDIARSLETRLAEDGAVEKSAASEGGALFERPQIGRFARWLAAAIVFSAVAVGIWVLPKRSVPESADLASKGEPTLSLWVERDGAQLSLEGTRPLVKAGERLQPALALDREQWLALFVEDPSGDVSTLVAEGSRAAQVGVRSLGAFGPSFRVDEEVGRYRLVLFRADVQFELREAERAVRSGAHFDGKVQTLEFAVTP